MLGEPITHPAANADRIGALTSLALLRGVALVPVPMAGDSQVRHHLLRASDLLTGGRTE